MSVEAPVIKRCPIMQNPGDLRLPKGFTPTERPTIVILSDGEKATEEIPSVRLPGNPSTEEDEAAARKETTLLVYDS